jgi:hypothetical protein
MITAPIRSSGVKGSATSIPATVPCPECRCGMPLEAEVCEVCLADLGERSMSLPAAGLPPAAAADLRFDDVIAELEALARLGPEREEVSEAALRAGALLARLRSQFMRELGLPTPTRAGTSISRR